METKQCSNLKCNELLPIEAFGLCENSKDGRQYWCRKCSQERNRQYKKANIEKVRESLRKSHLKHREHNKEVALKWQKANKEYLKNKRKLYYATNKERCLEQTRKWRKENPGKVREYTKQYGLLNYDKVIDRHRLWRKQNPEKAKESAKLSQNKKLKTPQGRLNHNISHAIRFSLRGGKQGRHWESLVGYTLSGLMAHLEKNFKPGMGWKNVLRGEIHIDHIIPISAFNFEKPEDEDFKKCWSLKNLQPMWAIDNIKKSNKLEKHFQPELIFK